MINQGLLDSPVFAFWLGSDPDQGEAIFGGVDKSHYTGKIDYVPVRRKGYWEVELESVKFGKETLELENTGAAIDTGEFFFSSQLQLFERFTDFNDAQKTNDRNVPHRPPHGRCRIDQPTDQREEILERTIHRRM